MKNFIQIIMVLLLSSVISLLAHATSFVENDFGNDKIEGLAYINIKAKQFINEYNQQNHTNWQSLEPNAKILVPKCVVELKVKLSNNILGNVNSPNKDDITVFCEKTHDPNQKKWRVLIHVYK